MKKLFSWQNVSALGVAAAFVLFAAGSIEPQQPNTTGGSSNSEALGIPSDAIAEANPVVSDPNINVPGCSYVVCEENGHQYVAITMNGIWDPQNEEWLKLIGTGLSGQNIWISLDNLPKGIDVYNNSENEGNTLIADVVFLVDNSGSMSEEANDVADNIITWTQQLEASGLDIRVGIVGYGGYYSHSIGGALNITTADDLKTYLDRSWGTNRTRGFEGPDAQELQAIAQSGNYQCQGYEQEDGVVALRFAHDNFNFRSGANRIYVNFTDEPNQPAGKEAWSVEWLNPENGNWKPEYGTVHTVYSSSKFDYNNTLWTEQPWLMSDYTGGTTIFTNPQFSDVSLLTLPVTGSLQNSYLIRFTDIDEYVGDGQPHTIKMTILTPSGVIAGEITFQVMFD